MIPALKIKAHQYQEKIQLQEKTINIGYNENEELKENPQIENKKSKKEETYLKSYFTIVGIPGIFKTSLCSFYYNKIEDKYKITMNLPSDYSFNVLNGFERFIKTSSTIHIIFYDSNMKEEGIYIGKVLFFSRYSLSIEFDNTRIKEWRKWITKRLLLILLRL